MYRIYFRASIYIVVASVMMVAIASIVIINLGERASNVLSSTTAMASSWHTICLVINGVEAKLYLADTSSKQTEGYMFKNSTDFLGIGAVGMLFNISTQPGYSVAFTMKNVAFPLYLLHITHVEGVGDVAVDIIYMNRLTSSPAFRSSSWSSFLSGGSLVPPIYSGLHLSSGGQWGWPEIPQEPIIPGSKKSKP